MPLTPHRQTGGRCGKHRRLTTGVAVPTVEAAISLIRADPHDSDALREGSKRSGGWDDSRKRLACGAVAELHPTRRTRGSVDNHRLFLPHMILFLLLVLKGTLHEERHRRGVHGLNCRETRFARERAAAATYDVTASTTCAPGFFDSWPLSACHGGLQAPCVLRCFGQGHSHRQALDGEATGADGAQRPLRVQHP